MGVPSCCLCSSHDSGVSTPSVFSQSKNTLGRSLNQLEISFARPNVKSIFSPFPLSHQFTHRSVHHPLWIPVDSLFSRRVVSGRPDETGQARIPEDAPMTSFSTRGWRVLILLAIVILLISTASHAQAPRKVKMTLPVVALTTAPVYLAETKGYFAQEGLTVDITVTGGGGPDIKALIAGDVDFTYTASD